MYENVKLNCTEALLSICLSLHVWLWQYFYIYVYMQVSAVLQSAEIVASLSPPMMTVALGILKESVRS